MEWISSALITFAIGYPLMVGGFKAYAWLSEQKWFTDRGLIIGRPKS